MGSPTLRSGFFFARRERAWGLCLFWMTLTKTFRTMWKEFKAFIMRGNILELATAVIIAGAFGAVVNSFTEDVLLPPIGLLIGGVDFSDLSIELKGAELGTSGEVVQEAVSLHYGKFIQSIFDFLIIAFSIFLVLKAYEKTAAKKQEAPAAPAGPTTEELLTQIRDLLKK